MSKCLNNVDSNLKRIIWIIFLYLVIVDTNGDCVTAHFYTGGGSTTPNWDIKVTKVHVLINLDSGHLAFIFPGHPIQMWR